MRGGRAASVLMTTKDRAGEALISCTALSPRGLGRSLPSLRKRLSSLRALTPGRGATAASGRAPCLVRHQVRGRAEDREQASPLSLCPTCWGWALHSPSHSPAWHLVSRGTPRVQVCHRWLSWSAGCHGQAAQPDRATVEAPPACWVLLAPLALWDGTLGAAVALEAGMGWYQGDPSSRAFTSLSATDVARGQS